MTDRDFLLWIYERLVKVHGENELTDYMHKLKSIACSLPCKPNKRKVKLLAYISPAGNLNWWEKHPADNYAPVHTSWKRVPSEDKEIEIEE